MHLEVGCHLNGMFVRAFGYADDVILLEGEIVTEIKLFFMVTANIQTLICPSTIFSCIFYAFILFSVFYL